MSKVLQLGECRVSSICDKGHESPDICNLFTSLPHLQCLSLFKMDLFGPWVQNDCYCRCLAAVVQTFLSHPYQHYKVDMQALACWFVYPLRKKAECHLRKFVMQSCALCVCEMCVCVCVCGGLYVSASWTTVSRRVEEGRDGTTEGENDALVVSLH